MFRFTIRDLLWLMVVVAVALCWLITYRESTFLDEARIHETKQNAPLKIQISDLMHENDLLRAELQAIKKSNGN